MGAELLGIAGGASSPCATENSNGAGDLHGCANVIDTEQLLQGSERPTVVRVSGSTFSLRILAAAIILLFFYYAQGVVITLLLSILLAYFLDPAVELLERMKLPRTIGAVLMVLAMAAVMVAVGYGLWTRTADFAENWPKYSGVLR